MNEGKGLRTVVETGVLEFRRPNSTCKDDFQGFGF